jgi:ATP-dependent 26S proteasome regulatory subunit
VIENQEAQRTPEARWQEANEAYLAVQMRRLRLLVHRRVLWLRNRWQHDPLQNYQGLVVSEAEADRLLASEDREAEARFRRENPEAAAIGRSINELEGDLAAQVEASTGPPALQMLIHLFDLTPFERDLLVLCLAPELDASFERLYAYVQDDMNRGYPTPHLGLALFGGDAEPPAEWRSFAPEGPLRRFHLLVLEPGQLPGMPLGCRPLRLDERVAGYLRGVHSLDDRVAHLLQPLAPAPLAPAHQKLVEQLIRSLGAADGPYRWPAVNLTGAPGAGKGAVARALCDGLGLWLYSLDPGRLPSPGPERREVLRLLEREAVLHQLAMYVPVDETVAGSGDPVLDALLRDMGTFLIIGSRERQRSDREMVAVEVSKPDKAAQRVLWRQALADVPSLNGSVETVVQQFDFGPRAVAQSALAAETRARLRASDASAQVTANDLWQACREQAGWYLDELAQRVVPGGTWEDIVLPEDVFQQLREIAAQVANRPLVYEEWGFGARLNRGRGLSALFSGSSGTGKTMAAEILANHLRLDLYRIDLAGVVSKYIGETEKNLRKVFDSAEQSGAILFFDEADALFGKRTEVKDSHDRYANIEVNYLLQRMEEYKGLAILATNRKSALDQAFLRRLRFLIDFPFPEASSRLRIWQKVFPPQAAVGELDYGLLARIEIAGGNIKNIALNAAFLAADEGAAIGMAHVTRAAQREYAKMDRLISQAEFGSYYPAVES